MISQPLGRRYQGLVRVYPPGPRRDELLDTLTENADPARTWPTVRETLNLLRHGTAARLAQRGAKLTFLVTLWITFTAGLVGYDAGYWIAWQQSHPLPTGAEAAAIKRTVFGDLPVSGEDGAPLFVDSPDDEDRVPGHADYRADFVGGRAADFTLLTQQARAGLAASGWHIRSVTLDAYDGRSTPWHSTALWATRGNLVLTWEVGEDWTRATTFPTATMTLSRAAPAALVTLSMIGAATAVATALALSLFVRRRIRGRPVTARICTAAAILLAAAFLPGTLIYLFGPFLLLLALLSNPRLVLHASFTNPSPTHPEQPPPLYAPWKSDLVHMPSLNSPSGYLAIALTLGVLALACWPRRATPPAETAPTTNPTASQLPN